MMEFVYPHTHLVAGVDEVGRGPLVGAVVTAAVILDPAKPILVLPTRKSSARSGALRYLMRSKKSAVLEPRSCGAA